MSPTDPPFQIQRFISAGRYLAQAAECQQGMAGLRTSLPGQRRPAAPRRRRNDGHMFTQGVVKSGQVMLSFGHPQTWQAVLISPRKAWWNSQAGSGLDAV